MSLQDVENRLAMLQASLRRINGVPLRKTRSVAKKIAAAPKPRKIRKLAPPPPPKPPKESKPRTRECDECHQELAVVMFEKWKRTCIQCEIELATPRLPKANSATRSPGSSVSPTT